MFVLALLSSNFNLFDEEKSPVPLCMDAAHHYLYLFFRPLPNWMVPVELRILSEEPTFQTGTPTIRTHVLGPTPELCRRFTSKKLAETDFFPEANAGRLPPFASPVSVGE